MLPVRQSVQQLQQIEGNPLWATKKKHLTCARESTDPDRSSQTCEKPSTYSAFLRKLNKACDQGDGGSRRAIEKLSPLTMAAALIAPLMDMKIPFL